MIEIFEYLQHFQRQVEIFKKHVNTGISSFHNTGFAECLRYNDGARKKVKNGKMVAPETGNVAPLERPGYPEEFLKELVKATGDRYKSVELK